MTIHNTKKSNAGSQPAGVRMRAYRMRIYPTPEQAGWIHRMFGQSRFVFNEALALWRKTKETTGKGLSYIVCANRLPAMKKAPETEWLSEGDSIALQSSIRNLADAWDRFYRKQNREPRFKSRKNPVQSYTTRSVNGNIKVADCWIDLPKVGRIRTVVSRPLTGRIISATVKRHGSGRHYVSVICEEPISVVCNNSSELLHTGRSVAIDLGVKNYATMFDSDGKVTVVPNPRHFQKLEERLAVEQRKLSGKPKYLPDSDGNESKSRMRQARKVARVHDKQATDSLLSCRSLSAEASTANV